MQTTRHVMMIRPASFRMNEQTAVNNYYQKVHESIATESIRENAQNEFNKLVDLLRTHGVEVTVFDDTQIPEKPDSLFPNNWISFHADARYVLYPMFAENRRHERRIELLSEIWNNKEELPDCLDFSGYENNGKFLEGTGSLVLDRINKIAFAAISPRTDQELVLNWCERMNYRAVTFHANQIVLNQRKAIYHTNVMMSIGSEFVVICPETIDDLNERENVLAEIAATGREIVQISEIQVSRFAGNMLELKDENDGAIIVMSDAAFNSLTAQQRGQLNAHGKLIHSSLQYIETFGGGSARCMIAELF